MKNTSLLLLLLISFEAFSQNNKIVDLSKIRLCELTIDNLKEQDSNLKQVELEEMDMCSDEFVQDRRFENRIGYESELYPGVIFQKYQTDDIIIAKIHLKREFKGYLPDGNYIELKTLKASDVLKKYDSLETWTSRGCSDYWGIKKDDKLNFYVKIDKDKKPQYPVDIKYYSDQYIQGIDIISDCYSYNQKTKANPLYIVDGKEVTEEFIRDLKPEDVDSITVLKDKSAVDKYGVKGKNGVLEIKLKKK
ncbi:hypothetical protein [Flavobacterium sp. XGLA_31]|uniref:hypothetical protein n=1 Tax=Flavobacterium sp. XGLA_31 TaxID=3447666 RepID=UPI003F40597B